MAELPAHLQQLIAAEYPRFSDAEMTRRRAAMQAALIEAGAEHLVFCGYNRTGSAVQWLTQWPVTTEAIGVFSPGKPDALYVQYVNHAPLARRIADRAETVEWGGESSIRKVIAELERRGARSDRVAVVGPMHFEHYAALEAKFGKLINLNRAYVRLRRVKSAEELDWLRIGAHFSDRGMAALRDAIRPGASERQLCDAVERAYVADGGGTGIHFIGTTSMHNAQLAVPRQFPSARLVKKGDVVVAEITAHFFDYGGQVLRSFTVGEEPTPLYRALHDAASAAFDAIAAVLKAGTTPAEVIAASRVIEDAGFTIIDDLLHGYGGGYLPPILGSTSRPAGPVPEEPFAAGQTVVIQPNVVTRDHSAGVQTGELVVITETGVRSLHAFPRGFAQV
ncbi:MAG TPA: M24 family metallopeptidase [Xanthobacteraceae bacterium]|nr:M24 family metallopeptidase [Xanthobacteraceae bacterium]